jgi:hypothetical protein
MDSRELDRRSEEGNDTWDLLVGEMEMSKQQGHLIIEIVIMINDLFSSSLLIWKQIWCRPSLWFFFWLLWFALGRLLLA